MGTSTANQKIVFPLLLVVMLWLAARLRWPPPYDPGAPDVVGAIDVLRRARYRILMSREDTDRQAPREQETRR